MALNLSGCGYHRIGGVGSTGAAAAGGIHIPIFVNNSYRAGLETPLTQSVIDQIARHSGGNVVDEDAARFVLSGAVLSYTVAPVSYTARDTIREYQATVKMVATFSERQTGKVMWKGQLAAHQVYPANVNLALQQNSEAAAIIEICRKLAEALHENMQEDF